MNPKVRIIKEHIEQQPDWALLLDATRCLDEGGTDGKGKTKMLKFADFQRFGGNLHLNELETEIVFHQIDRDSDGKVSMDEVFEWLVKKLITKCKTKRKGKERHRNGHDKANAHRRPRIERKSGNAVNGGNRTNGHMTQSRTHRLNEMSEMH